MSESGPTRRRVLSGVAGLATVGLAGCSALEPGSLEPEVPRDRLRRRGWTRVERLDETRSQTLDVAGVNQRVRTRVIADVYENHRTIETLSTTLEINPDRLPMPGEVFVASKAKVEPSVLRMAITSDALLDRFVEELEGVVQRQLEQRGFEDVRQVDAGELDIEAAGTATHRRYRADFHYDEREVVRSGRIVTLLPGSVTAEAQMALWPYDGLLVTSGGLYPAENEQLRFAFGDTERAIDLDLQPARSRRSIRELIRAVA